MKFKEYEWDDINTEHIFRHGVIPNEAEECCYNDPVVLKASRGRYIALGQTNAGRYLFVVVKLKDRGRVRVITARDMSKIDRGTYRKKKKR